MRFQNVIIVGSGQLALWCSAYIKEKTESTNNTSYIYFDTSDKISVMMEKGLKLQKIKYECGNKNFIFEKIRKTNGYTLVISAINPFLFPKDIVKDKKIEIINCHQSLLPNHPGRNAEAWAIFEGDKVAGVTWHKVTEDVDAGNILIQKQIKLTDEITSCQLFKKQINIAYKAFIELMSEFLNQQVWERVQEGKDIMKRKIHYSWEVPNDGYLDLKWDSKKISAFLRSMDYGVLCILGYPKIVINGQEYIFKKYEIKKIVQNNVDIVLKKEEKQISIYKDNLKFKLLQYSKNER